MAEIHFSRSSLLHRDWLHLWGVGKNLAWDFHFAEATLDNNTQIGVTLYLVSVYGLRVQMPFLRRIQRLKRLPCLVMKSGLTSARSLDTEPPGIYSIQNAEERMRRMSYAFKDLVADVREIVQKGVDVSSGPSASIIVRNVFYPEKNLVKTVKSGNLLVRSQAGYDTFFADAQKSVA